MTTVHLEHDESALILRANGELELCTPELEVRAIVPDDIIILTGMLLYFDDEAFRSQMIDMVRSQMWTN